jgi:membrane associated rhomboid family serine protease
MEQADKNRLLKSFIIPGILLGIMWLVKCVEIWLKIDFSEYGIYPQHLEGLRGIVLSPFLHSSFAHLSANSVPFFVLAAGLYYFYEKAAARIFIILWLVTGFWVWIFAKDTGIHIGASGVVYALAFFHFTSGLLRREPRMMAFSLLVVFLYGGLIWGIIPNFFPEKNISWESHFMGLLAGIIIAFFYSNEGPKRKEYIWDEEEPDEPDEEPPAIAENEILLNSAEETRTELDDSSRVVYHLKRQTLPGEDLKV